MTYCKQQIPWDFYIVNDITLDSDINIGYIYILKRKRELHKNYYNRILKLEELKNEETSKL